MSRWPVQDAKAEVSERLQKALSKLTNQDSVVLEPIEYISRRSPFNLLLGEGPRFDLPLPKRGQGHWRMDGA